MEELEMDKKARSIRGSVEAVQGSPGSKASSDRQSIGTGGGGGEENRGGESSGLYVNQRGEVCYGNDCVTVAVDQERHEIRVNIKRGGSCNIDPLVESLKKTLGEGDSRTVYEVESVVREKPKE